jgi:hypothetical protein
MLLWGSGGLGYTPLDVSVKITHLMAHLASLTRLIAKRVAVKTLHFNIFNLTILFCHINFKNINCNCHGSYFRGGCGF